jgi:hypothetical protein
VRTATHRRSHYRTLPHCHTLPHTAAHCPHTAAHCRTLPRTLPHCCTLPHTAACTAIQNQAHCHIHTAARAAHTLPCARTATHCRQLLRAMRAHYRTRCHTLPRTTARTACILLCALPHTATHYPTYDTNHMLEMDSRTCLLTSRVDAKEVFFKVIMLNMRGLVGVTHTAARTATHCRTLPHCHTAALLCALLYTTKHTAAHWYTHFVHTPMRTATHCRSHCRTPPHCHTAALLCALPYTKHTAAHCCAHFVHTPMHTATHCHSHCRTPPHCRTLLHTAAYCRARSHTLLGALPQTDSCTAHTLLLRTATHTLSLSLLALPHKFFRFTRIHLIHTTPSQSI